MVQSELPMALQCARTANSSAWLTSRKLLVTSCSHHTEVHIWDCPENSSYVNIVINITYNTQTINTQCAYKVIHLTTLLSIRQYGHGVTWTIPADKVTVWSTFISHWQYQTTLENAIQHDWRIAIMYYSRQTRHTKSCGVCAHHESPSDLYHFPQIRWSLSLINNQKLIPKFGRKPWLRPFHFVSGRGKNCARAYVSTPFLKILATPLLVYCCRQL